MRRAGLFVTFLAGLGVGVAVMATVVIRHELVAAEQQRAQAQYALLEATRTTVAPQNPPALPLEAPTPLTASPAVPLNEPPTTEPRSATALPPMAADGPKPATIATDESIQNLPTAPEVQAEDFVNKTREELQSRLKDLQSEKNSLETRLGKIDKYSGLMRSLLSSFDDQQQAAPPTAKCPNCGASAMMVNPKEQPVSPDVPTPDNEPSLIPIHPTNGPQ